MGLFSFTRKKETVVVSQNTKDVEGAEVWVVSWKARHGAYFGDYKRVAKAFLNEPDMETFVESLKKAAELLQYTEPLDIKIEKQL